MKEMQEAQKRSEEGQKKTNDALEEAKEDQRNTQAKIDLLLKLFENNRSNSFVDMFNKDRSNSKDRGRG